MSGPVDEQLGDGAELRATLAAALSEFYGAERSVTAFSRRPSAYSTSFAIEELGVELDDGTALEIVFKNLSSAALVDEARGVRPNLVYDPVREIQVYRRILAASVEDAAACYGAVVDDARDRYWLFLEKVPGVELYQVGDFSTWCDVARWLAGVHGRLASVIEPQIDEAHLLRHDEEFFRIWPERVLTFLGGHESTKRTPERAAVERLANGYQRVVEHLVALPVTLVHGDFNASNVLVHEQGRGRRVCPVDWEMAAVGPGLIDLAALCSGGWKEDEKIDLAAAYADGLAAHDGRSRDFDTLLESLRYCRLHLALQWLGWAPDWSPPREHRHDWLAEALRLADELGL